MTTEAAATAPTPAQLVALAKLLAERNKQLERALETRIVIEQAKGVLAERLAIEPQLAFEVLRRAARNQRRRIHEVADEVVSSRHTPAAVQEAAALHTARA